MADVNIRIIAIDEFTQTFKQLESSMKNLQMPNLTSNLTSGMDKIVQTIKPMKAGLDSSVVAVKSFQKEMDQLPVQPVDSLTKALGRGNLSMSKFKKEMGDFVDIGDGMWNQLTGETLSYGKAVDIGKIKSKRFRMEWLSVLFTGMAIERAFSGIVNAQFQLYGITQLMSDAWSVVMIPVMNVLAPLLYQLIDAFMNMPEPMQMALGIFILLGFVIGKLLSVVGMGFLAFQGFATILAGAGIEGGAFAGVLGAISAAFLPIAIIIGIIILLAISMWDAWNKNFMGMRDIVSGFVDGIKQMFGGLFDVIIGIFQFFYALLTGDTEGAKAALQKIWEGLVNFILGLGKALVLGVAALIVGIINLVINVVKVVSGLIASLAVFIWDSLKGLPQKMLQWGIDFVMNIINGILSLGRKVIDAILSLFPAWMRRGIEAGGQIVLDIVQNVKEVFTGGSTRSRAIGGIIPETDTYLLHQGEMVVPRKDVNAQSGNTISVNPVYYVNVSDKNEFEKLLRENNLNLVNDIKRLI